MRERYQVVLESTDPAVSVVVLRRLLKHLGRSYGLRALRVRREDPDPTSGSSPRARRKAPRRRSRVTFPLPRAHQALPGGRLRKTGGFLTQRSEPVKEGS